VRILNSVGPRARSEVPEVDLTSRPHRRQKFEANRFCNRHSAETLRLTLDLMRLIPQSRRPTPTAPA
jgi:hypothetical protein